MTEFEFPENIKNQALMINALHYMSTTSEVSFEHITEILNRNAQGDTPPPEVLHKILMHIAHQFMTFTMLCDEVMEEFMADSRAFNKDHQGNKDEIQAILKATPFMKRMMQIVSEGDEDRAMRLVTEAVGEGMPDDLADEIRQMMKND